MINSKKAKALRKFLRQTEVDFRETLYQAINRPVWVIREGLPIQKDRIQMRLNPRSGRATYQRLKPLWA